MKQYFQIAGSARVLPRCQVLSTELDRRLGLPAGWTAERTGVLFRHQCSGVEEAKSMTNHVCRAALAEASIGLPQLDIIVDASLCQQQPIPCNAALVQETLGSDARRIPGIDVHASCLGFVAALNVVNGLFASGSARSALITCVETPLQGVNWNQPESACLMGDAAVAFVLTASDAASRCDFLFETFADGAHLCEVRGGGHRRPPYTYTEAERAHYQFHMDGQAVHRLASKVLPPMLARLKERMGCSLAEVDVVPHQASGPALELMRRRLGIPSQRFHVSIAQHGNIVAAGIPYVLDGVRRQKPVGTRVMVVGTAAGYTQAVGVFSL